MATEFLRRILDLEPSELIIGLVWLGCDTQWPLVFTGYISSGFNRTLCGFKFWFDAMIDNVVLFYPREEHSVNFFTDAPHGGSPVVCGFRQKIFHRIKD